ncbi:Rho GTPase-activating protein [Pseudohyphozyma bogoriensis]|nr:Rho GTPase-activating protein [Pseudohyphozyma bogoriensis]
MLSRQPAKNKRATLDLILSSPILTIVDHLALAGVNRTLRSLYYSPPVAASHAQFEGLKLPTSELWRALNLFRPFVGSNNAGQAEKTEGSGEEVGPETLVEGLVSRIWSNAESARAKAGEMVVLQEVEKEGALRLKRKGGWEMERLPGVKYWRLVRSKEWEEAIGRCSKETIAQASAVRAYKVPKATLVKEFGQAEEYKEPRVLALALRLHGGVWGHQEWVTQKNEVNAKAKEARQKGKSGKGRRRRG